MEMRVFGSRTPSHTMGHTMRNHSEAGVKVTEADQERWMDRLMTLTLDDCRRPQALSTREHWQLDHQGCCCGVQTGKRAKKTKCIARFSTVGGEKGSPDSARDPRGLSLMFHAEDCSWDWVFNSTPIIFLRDPSKSLILIDTAPTSFIDSGLCSSRESPIVQYSMVSMRR